MFGNKHPCQDMLLRITKRLRLVQNILLGMSERKMWRPDEDEMIRKIVKENDRKKESQKWKWSEIAEILQQRIPNCSRSGKQCRERWFNHLNPGIIKDRELSQAEISQLFALQSKLGNRWAAIAKQFEGRTDNTLKNFFYSSLRRAIRQINHYVSKYKKKSNIKPFKQSLLAKVLNITDDKYRNKLDIKSNEAFELANDVKIMLEKLSTDPEEKVLDNVDIELRQNLVKNIQNFNKYCKKKKSKKAESQEQPDLDDISPVQDENNSQESGHRKRKVHRKNASLYKSEEKPQLQSELIRVAKKAIKNRQEASLTKRVSGPADNNEVKPLFRNPTKQPEQLPPNKTQLVNRQQSGHSSVRRMSSRSSGRKKSSQMDQNLGNSRNPFKLESLEPSDSLFRRSSYEDNRAGFLSNLANWSRKDSRNQLGLFGPEMSGFSAAENLMIESINIGEQMAKVNEGSLNESQFYKLIRQGSHTDKNA